jgi:hypothetical protein
MLRKAFAVCLIALAGQAHAGMIIDTSVGKYEVSTIFASFDAAENVLESQVWCCTNGVARAAEFASLVGGSLGFPNGGALGPFGPLFAFSTIHIFVSSVAFSQTFDCCFIVPSSIFFNPLTYAIAQPVPEPSAPSLLAAGVLGLVLLRLRRRTT